MVAHLKKHGLSDTAKAQELADKFLDSSGKRFWSCGFCVQVFGSFDDRLNHLRDHFEQYPTVDQWRLSNEVQGLLQQPGVTQAWDQLLGARYGRDRPQTFWPRSALVAQLNFDLQMGISDTQSAQDLAEAAYAASNLGQDLSSPKLGSLVPYGSFGTSRESQPQILTLPAVAHRLSDSHEGATSDENTNTREPFTNGMVDQMNDGDFYSFIDPRLISDPNPSLSDFPEW